MDLFNPDMMVLARESRALTQGELSDRLGMGQGTLSKYENGLQVPSDDVIQGLCSSLAYPREFFFEPGRPYGLPPFHYRRRKKLGKKILGRIVAEINIKRIHIAKMLRSFDVAASSRMPEIDIDEFQGKRREAVSMEDIARSVRERWMLPSGPIQNLMALLEENGGIVVPCDFGTDLLDAMSQRIDGMPVLFFVNENAPADRVRHTLAHELGHMVLHTTTVKNDDEMEDEADAFAGSFLMPADEIRPQLRKFDLRQLANMKLHWKVSMAAIAVRADRLKLITPYQSKMFWMEMNRLGYRRREPNEPIRETPSLLRQMVAFHVNKLGYTVSDMARMLRLTESEFISMYGRERLGSPDRASTRSHLRVVK